MDVAASPLFFFDGYLGAEGEATVNGFHLTGDTVEQHEDGSISFVVLRPGHVADTRGSVERLRTISGPVLRIEVYDGSGHAIQQPPQHGDALIRPDALDDLTSFVTAAVEQLAARHRERRVRQHGDHRVGDQGL